MSMTVYKDKICDCTLSLTLKQYCKWGCFFGGMPEFIWWPIKLPVLKIVVHISFLWFTYHIYGVSLIAIKQPEDVSKIQKGPICIRFPVCVYSTLYLQFYPRTPLNYFYPRTSYFCCLNSFNDYFSPNVIILVYNITMHLLLLIRFTLFFFISCVNCHSPTLLQQVNTLHPHSASRSTSA